MLSKFQWVYSSHRSQGYTKSPNFLIKIRFILEESIRSGILLMKLLKKRLSYIFVLQINLTKDRENNSLTLSFAEKIFSFRFSSVHCSSFNVFVVKLNFLTDRNRVLSLMKKEFKKGVYHSLREFKLVSFGNFFNYM